MDSDKVTHLTWDEIWHQGLPMGQRNHTDANQLPSLKVANLWLHSVWITRGQVVRTCKSLPSHSDWFLQIKKRMVIDRQQINADWERTGKDECWLLWLFWVHKLGKIIFHNPFGGTVDDARVWVNKSIWKSLWTGKIILLNWVGLVWKRDWDYKSGPEIERKAILSFYSNPLKLFLKSMRDLKKKKGSQ